MPRPEGRHALRIRDYGSFDHFYLADRLSGPSSLGPDQVEVRLEATGLNFKECLIALGRLDDTETEAGSGAFGLEGAGRVVRVGSNVDDLAEGDEVIVWASGCLASHVVVDRWRLLRKPTTLSWAEAAGLPTAFMTAQYALHQVADVRPGDKVLIHSCAGGVGQAALHIALGAGAKVFATASREKWDSLRSQGVEHVMDSRSPTFAQEIRDLTSGHGVDVVLNSLTGDAIRESFDALAEGGRFVEIGKVGIWSAAEATEYRPDVAYVSFELGLGDAGGPGTVDRLLAPVLARIQQGAYPLPRTRVFPLSDVRSAFRWLASGKSVGKIVVAAQTEARRVGFQARQDGSYLITGGLGALGLHVAHWLVSRGARRLGLMSRRPPTDAVLRVLEDIRTQGVQIDVVSADVANREDVARAVAEIAPVVGVFHCAGMLDDGVLDRQTQSRFAAVLGPKVTGAENLHAATREQPLEHFVCFSSTSALFDGRGQGNYAAANAYLDGFAHFRRSLGLPATSVNWGAWAGGGMAAQLEQAGRRGLLEPDEAISALEGILEDGDCQAVVTRIEHHIEGGRNASRMLDAIRDLGASRSANAVSFRELCDAQPNADRAVLLREVIRAQVAKVLGTRDEDVGDTDSFVDAGIDSLMMTELRNNLQTMLGAPLRAGVIFAHPNVDSLARHLAEQLSPESDAPDQAAKEGPNLTAITTLADAPHSGRHITCLPGIGENIYDFIPLSEFRGIGSIHVLYDQAPEGQREGIEGFLRLSADFARSLRASYPGPYELVGYSYGGFLAVEIARRLIDEGELIDRLVLVDSIPYFRLADHPLAGEIAELSLAADHLEGMGEPCRVPPELARMFRDGGAPDEVYHAMGPLRALVGDRMAGVPGAREAWEATVEGYRRRLDMLRGYDVAAGSFANVDVRLVRATTGVGALANAMLCAAAEVPDPDALGWSSVLGKTPAVVAERCSHREILRHPHVTAVARTLTDGIEHAPREAGVAKVVKSGA